MDWERKGSLDELATNLASKHDRPRFIRSLGRLAERLLFKFWQRAQAAAEQSTGEEAAA